MAYYIGIDGGGSKTTCAVGDDEHVIATATAGPSNITRVGEVQARESLHTVIRAACAMARIDPAQIKRACVGVAGAGREEVAVAVRKIVAEMVPGEIDVVGDMAIALDAAFGSGPGVIVIAGTGSIAYARNARGETARAGGWGCAVSDQGSAHWIGRAVVRDLLEAADRGLEDGKDAESAAQALPLFRELAAVWRVSSLDEFVRKANSNPDFAELFPAIVAAGDSGDALALRILTMAGALLAGLAGVVRHIFKRDKPEISSIPLAVAGGVFRHSSRVREVFGEEVCKFDARILPNLQVVEPLAGALQLARKGNAKR